MKMSGLGILGLSLILAGDGLAATARNPIAGIWQFEKEVDRGPDGSTVVVGPNQGYEGMVIFTPDGFMSGTVMPRGRKWTVESASLDDLRGTVEMGTAYSGRYTVDPATQTLSIDVIGGMDPGDVGKRLTRHYALDRDALLLSGTWHYQGRTLGFTLTFVPLK